MQRQHLMMEARDLLVQFVSRVKADTEIRHTDINVEAETFLAELLKEVFGYASLRNLNQETKNAAGIDLADDVASVAYQVTSSPTLKKVKETIETCIRYGAHERYSRFKIFVITEKNKSYSQAAVDKVSQGKISFDVKTDIQDYRDVLKGCESLDPEKLTRVVAMLRREFGTPAASSLERSSPKDDADTLKEYLDAMIRECEFLDPVSDTGADAPVGLEQVYLSLRAEKQLRELEVDRRGLERELQEVRRDIDALDDPELRAAQQKIVEQLYNKVQQSLKNDSETFDLHDLVGRHRALVVLGEPGSGKTTAMRYVALQFARAVASRADQFLGVNAGVDDQSWNMSDGLGGVRVPVLIRISRYCEARIRGSTPQLSIVDYLPSHLQNLLPTGHKAERTSKLLFKLIETGKTIFLFDGLDELVSPGEREQIRIQLTTFSGAYLGKGIAAVVPATGTRAEGSVERDPRVLGRLRVSNELRSMAARVGGSPIGNRMVVTSRIAGYSLSRLQNFETFVISRMSEEAISSYVRKWMSARESRSDINVIDEKVEDVITSIQSVDGVRRFAENPLLLRLVLMLQEDARGLPRRRYELYERAAQHLTGESAQKLRPLPGDLKNLSEEPLFRVLGRVSMWLHHTHPGGIARASEIEAIVSSALVDMSLATRETASRMASSLVGWLSNSTGMFMERAQGLLGFMHRTFAEFFTAREIVCNPESFKERILGLAHQPMWREPLLLAVGSVRLIPGRDIIAAILKSDSPFEKLLHRDLLFAADCLSERVEADIKQVTAVTEKLLEIWLERRGVHGVPSLRSRIGMALRRLHATHAARIVEPWLIEAFREGDLNRVVAACGLAQLFDRQVPAVAMSVRGCSVPIPEWCRSGSLEERHSVMTAESRTEITDTEIETLSELVCRSRSEGGRIDEADVRARVGRLPRSMFEEEHYEDDSVNESGDVGDELKKILLRWRGVDLPTRIVERCAYLGMSSSLKPDVIRETMAQVAVEVLLAGQMRAGRVLLLCRVMGCRNELVEKVRREIKSNDLRRRARILTLLGQGGRWRELVADLESELSELLDRPAPEALAAFSVLVQRCLTRRMLAWAFSAIRNGSHEFRDEIRLALKDLCPKLSGDMLAELRGCVVDPAVSHDAIALLVSGSPLGCKAVGELTTWLDDENPLIRTTAAIVLAPCCSPDGVGDVVQDVFSMWSASRGGMHHKTFRRPGSRVESVKTLTVFERACDTNAPDDALMSIFAAALSDEREETIVAARTAGSKTRIWIDTKLRTGTSALNSAFAIGKSLSSEEEEERLRAAFILLTDGLARHLVAPLVEASTMTQEVVGRCAIWRLYDDVAGQLVTDGTDLALDALVAQLFQKKDDDNAGLSDVLCCGVSHESSALVARWLRSVTRDPANSAKEKWALSMVGYASVPTQEVLAEFMLTREASLAARHAASEALGTNASHRHSRHSPESLKVTRALIKALSCTDEGVKASAVKALGDSETEIFSEKAEALWEAASVEADVATRVSILSAIGKQIRADYTHVPSVSERLSARVPVTVSDSSERAEGERSSADEVAALSSRAILQALKSLIGHPDEPVMRAAAAAIAMALDVDECGMALVCEILERDDLSLLAFVDALGRRRDWFPHGGLEVDVASSVSRLVGWILKHPNRSTLVAVLNEEVYRLSRFYSDEMKNPRDANYLDDWTHAHAVVAVVSLLSEALPAGEILGSYRSEQLIEALLNISKADSTRVLGFCVRSLASLQEFTRKMVGPILNCADRRFFAYTACREAMSKFRRFESSSVQDLVQGIGVEQPSRAYFATLLAGELAASRPEDLGVEVRRDMAATLARYLDENQPERLVDKFTYRGRIEETVSMREVIYAALEKTVGVAALGDGEVLDA